MENTGQFPRQINSYKLKSAQTVITDNSQLDGACGVAKRIDKLTLSNVKGSKRGSLLPLQGGWATARAV